ncbi:MAG: NACHT domain-containing protein [Nostoc sp.]|uniref:WD40 domain-containing protein n=1 Tax=Nostoc sp. TaxID=1180 RepID=UPI002FF8B0A7
MLLPPIDQIIQAIASIASPFIKDKVQRDETVIKLLQRFKLDPEHPPSDFTGVYAYTLVEYGTAKPKTWLEIFRRKEIKHSFRKAFDHNNPSILLSEVDAFLDTYAIDHEIRNLGLDVRREVAEFATVFIEVVKRSRTPADVLMSHQLGSLHKRIAGIQEQLTRLTNLEGIRTEIARLATENYPALPEAYAATENNCQAISLAQQMRGWFETLGYRFEKYEVWQDGYFEWVVNIQIWRNGYQRFLIRGIAGEAGISDVMALRQSVEQQRTDGGWLVTARRISRAARDEVKKEENHNLGCYTFDELLAQDADFSGYLDWLEAEVKRKKIDTKYVPLACNKEEIDPVTKRQIAVSHYDEQEGWIDGYIDRWLDDPAKEHISILGEFGTGKTWFALHYAWVTLQRYRDAQKRGTELPRLPLVIPLRDYAKAVSIESLFSEFFFRQHKIPIPHYDAFVQLNLMGKLLLIFDGFDEMAARVDQQEMINNFWELAKVVVPGAKVILTCRTEYFPEAKEVKALLNAELQASTANLTADQPQFEVLELEKFNNDQIQQILSYFAETTVVKRIMRNPKLLDLARRPVMTELILEALPEIEADKPVDMSRVYLYAVRRKMEQDIKAERTFTSLADKLYFLCELSWEMLFTNQMSLNYRLFPERIRRLFSSVAQEQNLDYWHHDMMGQTMLIRNVDGDYTPSHRSLLEFFVAYKFAAELGVLASDFTELAQKQSCLNESKIPENYTWSSYFLRQLDETENYFEIPPLRGFRREPLEKLRDTFGKVPLTKVMTDLLLSMIDIETKETIIELIESTRGKSEEEVGYVGGNAATLVVKLDKVGLKSRDLSRTVVLGADFTKASLCGVNFTQANLANSVFAKILGAVWAVAFSPDGKLFATGGSNGVVSLWETASGREILTYKGHTNWIRSIAFSPDGATLASGSADHTVRLWDINTGECRNTFEGHISLVTSVAFNPNGAMLASGSDDQTIRLWDVNTGECHEPLRGHTSWVRSIAFSPDGVILASGSEDRTILLWDVNSGKEYREPMQGHTSWVHSVAFSPDGATLASGSADYTIRLWDINTGKYRILEGHTNWVTSVAFSPDGATLASGSQDHTMRLWDVNSGKECREPLQGHTSWVRSIAFSPDGASVISGSADHTVRLWDINTGECRNTLWGYINRVTSVAFSSDGATLASGSQDHIVRLWDVNSGKEYRKPLQGHIDSVTSVVFSPNRAILASGSADRTVRLWDVNSGNCLYTLQEHTNAVYCVAFSPDGATIASGSEDHTVRLWDVNSSKYRNTLQGHTSWVYSIAFSPDGATLASGSHDKTLRLWDIKSGKCRNILEGHTNRVYSIAFSPDGATIASSSFDTTIRLWDVKSGKCCNILEGHTKSVNSVAFSPDGTNIASGSEDYTVRLWDVKSGRCCNILEGHTKSITSVTFSPDGAILAGGSIDCKVQLWHIKAEHMKTLEYERPYDHMNITGVTGLTEAEIASLKALGAVDTNNLGLL